MKYLKIIIALLFLCSSFIVAMGQQQPEKLTPDQQAAKDRLDSAQKKVAQTQAMYHAMDNPTLLKRLAEQSRQQKEPFNSLAYRELRTRKDVDPKAIEAQIAEMKNGDALLALLLLRRLYEKNYLALPMASRVLILTDALGRSVYFNTWGLPNANLQEASQAMLECDSSAFPALKRMLNDKRPAPLFGSKEAMEYKRYQFRLCDFALFFLETMRNKKKYVMPPEPGERDRIIQAWVK